MTDSTNMHVSQFFFYVSFFLVKIKKKDVVVVGEQTTTQRLLNAKQKLKMATKSYTNMAINLSLSCLVVAESNP